MTREEQIGRVYRRITSGEYDGDYARFEGEALAAVGLEGHPKAGHVFALAWARGHASGFHDVLGCLIDFASLLVED